MQTWTEANQPLLYVLDRSFNLIQLEEHYSSLVWTERYQECGDFTLTIPLNKVNFKAYSYGNYLNFTDSEETMIIESIEIQDDYEEPQLEVSGRSLTSILTRRVNASKALDLNLGKIEYIGDFGSIVFEIINDEILNPFVEYYGLYHLELNDEGQLIESPGGGTDEQTSYLKRFKISEPNRVIPNFVYENRVTGESIDKRFEDIKTLYELLNIFCKKIVCGFKIILDSDYKFRLITYKGIDRTTKQQTLSPMIFSTELDNVSSVKYFEDHTDYKNVAFAYTSDEKKIVSLNFEQLGEISDNKSDESTYLWYSNKDDPNSSSTGIDRYEFAVKSNASIQTPSSETVETPVARIGGSNVVETEKAITLAEQLEVSGEEAFEKEDCKVVKTTEGTVDPLVRYKFGEDYYIGDKIEFFDNIGIHVIALIDEVVRSYDKEGYIVTPNFKTMDDYEYGDEGDPDGDDQET